MSKFQENRWQAFEVQKQFNSIDFTQIDPKKDQEFHNDFRDRLEALFVEVHFIQENEASQFFWIGKLGKANPVLGEDYLILRRNMELLDNPIMGEKDPSRYWLLVPSDGPKTIGGFFLQRPLNREKYRGNYFIFINLFSVLKHYIRRNFPWLMKGEDLAEEREEEREVKQKAKLDRQKNAENDLPRDQDTSNVTQYCTPQERMIRLNREANGAKEQEEQPYSVGRKIKATPVEQLGTTNSNDNQHSNTTRSLTAFLKKGLKTNSTPVESETQKPQTHYTKFPSNVQAESAIAIPPVTIVTNKTTSEQETEMGHSEASVTIPKISLRESDLSPKEQAITIQGPEEANRSIAVTPQVPIYQHYGKPLDYEAEMIENLQKQIKSLQEQLKILEAHHQERMKEQEHDFVQPWTGKKE